MSASLYTLLIWHVNFTLVVIVEPCININEATCKGGYWCIWIPHSFMSENCTSILSPFILFTWMNGWLVKLSEAVDGDVPDTKTGLHRVHLVVGCFYIVLWVFCFVECFIKMSFFSVIKYRHAVSVRFTLSFYFSGEFLMVNCFKNK